MMLFLDANAHLPMNEAALNSFIEFNKSIGGHGHAMAQMYPGRLAAAELEKSRDVIAELIGAQNSNQIVFTSTCTQACEWGLEILKNRNFRNIYCSKIEHSAISMKVREINRENGNLKDLLVSKDGMVSCGFVPEDSSSFICIHVQNEIGTVQPIESVKVPLFSDMSQSLGKLPLNVSSISNLNLATFGGHKFGGPVGVGILYIKDTNWWKEFGSGSRYFFDRSGTPDVGMVKATSVALRDAIQTLPIRYEKALRFKEVLENGLKELGLEIIGANGTRIPHTTFFRVGKGMGPFIASQLEDDRIFVGLGSACGSFTSKSSPVIGAMGLRGNSADFIRISQWGNYGAAEASFVVQKIRKYCSKCFR